MFVKRTVESFTASAGSRTSRHLRRALRARQSR